MNSNQNVSEAIRRNIDLLAKLQEANQSDLLRPTVKPPSVTFVNPKNAPLFVALGVIPEDYQHGKRYRKGGMDIVVSPLIPEDMAVRSEIASFS